MDSVKKPPVFGDIMPLNHNANSSVKKSTVTNTKSVTKPAVKIQNQLVKSNQSPKIIITKKNTNNKSTIKKISSLNLSNKILPIKSSDISYKLNNKQTEKPVVFKKSQKYKPNSIKYIQENKKNNQFNNQALLFENNSLFGNFSKKIKTNRDISGTPLIKRLKQKSIKKIPIESEARLNSRLKLNSEAVKSKPFIFKYIITFLMVMVIASAAFGFNSFINESKTINAESSDKTLVFENIEINQNSFNDYLNRYNVKSTEDNNDNELLNWQEYYLELDPLDNKTICQKENVKDLILNLTDYKSCKKIDLNLQKESKSVELLRYFLFENTNIFKQGEFSLVYDFGLINLEQFFEQKAILRDSNSEIVKENLISISKINAYINGRINNFNSINPNPLDGIYYLEVTRNYNIELSELLTFMYHNSNFGTSIDSNLDYSNIIEYGSYWEQIDTLDISDCEKYIIFDKNFDDCAKINSTIEEINQYLK